MDMYGIVPYIYHKNQLNVGNYTIIYHTWILWDIEGERGQPSNHIFITDLLLSPYFEATQEKTIWATCLIPNDFFWGGGDCLTITTRWAPTS